MKQVEEYIKSLEMSNKSFNTVRTYKKDIYKFIEFFNIKSVDDIQKLDQSNYRDFISSLSVSPSSINGCIRNLSAFHTWLQDNEYIKDSSFFKVKFGKSRFVKVEKKLKDVLNDDEIVKIIKSADTLQEKFMIALMVFTAIRRDEVCKIKLSDINNCAIVINGKGSKQRRVFLNEQLCQMLNIYLAERNTECEYLFYWGSKKISGVTVNNRVLRAFKNAGIENKKITAHRLRATALTNIIREFGILAAQKVAGHSNIMTTRIYDNSGDEVVMNALLNSKKTYDLSD